MWRHRAARLFLTLILLLSALNSGARADEAGLYAGGSSLGGVPSVKRGAHRMVSALSMAKTLGMESSVKGDTLTVSAGRSKIRLVEGAAAAWLDAELVPLAASTLSEGKEWFVESRSALKLFNSLLVRSGKEGNLAWGEAPPAGTSVPRPSTSLSSDPPPAKPEPPSAPVSTSGGPMLNKVRWGSDDGKIRVVLDYEGSAAPQIREEGGTVKAEFALGKAGLPDLASPYGEVKVSSVNFGDRIALSFSSSLPLKEIIPLTGPPRIVIDYVRKGGAPPAASVKTPPAVPPAVSVNGPPRKTGPKVVVVDAGHGGKDPGTVANGLKEKDINLAVALLLAQNLKKQGFDARLTRDKDVYLTLQQRTELANKWNADVFVSIHANALPPGRHATGMEIYLMALPTDKDAMELALIENRELAEGNGAESAKAADKRTRMLLSILGDMQQNAKINDSTDFAECLFKEGSKGGIKMRRVAQAPFFVLRGAAMPAVLIETGFLTEKKEAAMLASKKYQNTMASSLARGIVQYLADS
ncbi:MAG: N-acetylmuramoyl-L-alanine amidase [Synergistaceae bacterium]|nr:N-acetylmuramoyl-L-alanine amidase [Synergistaceae bacterium]